MWYNNKSVIRTHCKKGTKLVWAYIDGIDGWKQIKPSTSDGVMNVNMILSSALANSRKVDVYIVDNQIQQATLR